MKILNLSLAFLLAGSVLACEATVSSVPAPGDEYRPDASSSSVQNQAADLPHDPTDASCSGLSVPDLGVPADLSVDDGDEDYDCDLPRGKALGLRKHHRCLPETKKDRR